MKMKILILLVTLALARLGRYLNATHTEDGLEIIAREVKPYHYHN